MTTVWGASIQQNTLTDHSGYLISDKKLTKTRMTAIWGVTQSVQQNTLTDHSDYLISDKKLTKTRMTAIWGESVQQNTLTDRSGYLILLIRQKVNQNYNDCDVRSVSRAEQSDYSGYLISDKKLTQTRMTAMWEASVAKSKSTHSPKSR